MPGGLSDSSALTRDHDVALLDLDGVVYVGGSAVPGAVAAVDRVRAAGMRVGYVTNNAARPPRAVATQLRGLGLSLDDADVVTSAQAAARLVAGRVPSGSRVLVVGGAGLVEALAEHRLHAVSRLDDEPAAVVQGFAPEVGWELLAEGAYAVAAGEAQHAEPRPLTPGYLEYEEILSDAFEDIRNGADAGEALSGAADRIDREMEKYRR